MKSKSSRYHCRRYEVTKMIAVGSRLNRSPRRQKHQSLADTEPDEVAKQSPVWHSISKYFELPTRVARKTYCLCLGLEILLHGTIAMHCRTTHRE